MAIARTLSRPRAEHSYLLRVIVVASGVRRFMLQDLRSGEQSAFGDRTAALPRPHAAAAIAMNAAIDAALTLRWHRGFVEPIPSEGATT